MTPEQEQVLSKIKDIKNLLNRSHDGDPDYLPQHLRELRTYILQVHASYERSFELIIYKDYLKSSESFLSFEKLFERMTFEDKKRLAHSIHTNFPNSMATNINELRNNFAHKKGMDIRNTYNTDEKCLKAYELLEQAHRALNNFFEHQQRASKLKQ